MEMGKLIDIIWSAAYPYFQQFYILGVATFTVLFGLEIAKESLDIVSGRGFKLDKKLLTFLIIGALVTSYIQIAKGFYFTSKSVVVQNKSVSDRYWDTALEAQEGRLTVMDLESSAWDNFWAGVWYDIKSWFSGTKIAMGLCHLLHILSLFIFEIMIVVYFVAYMLTLVVGQFFIMFLISEDFKQAFFSWFSNVIAYFILFPMYTIALAIATEIKTINIEEMMLKVAEGEAGWIQAMISIFKSLICIGIAFIVPNVARSVTGTLISAESGLAGFALGGVVASRVHGVKKKKK
jgi:hypothetical protein